MNAQTVYYGALALAAIIGGIIALYKLKPESTKVYVDIATNLATTASAREDRAIRRLDTIEERLTVIEAQLKHEREQRRLSNGYARTLAQVLRDHQMPVPPPPAGLDLD